MMLAIVTVNYNNANGLMETINSINSQSNKNFFWIFVDGGSNDGSVEIARDSKIEKKTIRSGPDNGIYDAMNIGTSMVPNFCEYIIYMNSGDVFFDENVVDDFYKEINGLADADVIYGGSVEVTGVGLRRKSPRPIFMIYFGMVAHHQAMFFKRTANLFYSIENSVAADYSMVCRLYGEKRKFRRYDRIVCKFGSPGMSLSKAVEGRLEASSARKIFLGTSDYFEWVIVFVQNAIFNLKKKIGYFK